MCLWKELGIPLFFYTIRSLTAGILLVCGKQVIFSTMPRGKDIRSDFIEAIIADPQSGKSYKSTSKLSDLH